MNEVKVDLLSQVADKKARDFAGRLGDEPLTLNWISRFNGYFSGYLCREADEYVKEESKRILAKMDSKTSKIPELKFPERVLFYHPESDAYVECLNKEEYDWLARTGGEPLDEVTGNAEHEARFLEQEKGKELDNSFDDLLGEYVEGEDLL